MQWVLEQLSGAGRISSRRMFGAVGLYQDDVFFAIISSDVLFFKVGDANRADYETRGAARFRPFPDKPRLSMSYYAVPADVLEDAEECADWVRRAVRAAVAAKALPVRKTRKAANPRGTTKTRSTANPGAGKTGSPAHPRSAHKPRAAAKPPTAAKPRRSGHLGAPGNPGESRKPRELDAKLPRRRTRS